MFETYRLRMEFTGRLCGSVPLSDQAIEGWLASRAAKVKPEKGPSLKEIEEEVRDSVLEEEEGAVSEKEKLISLGFQQQDGGFVVRAGTLKAHVKDCALQLHRAKVVKITSFRSKIANWAQVAPYWLSIKKDGDGVVKEPDGDFTQAVHTMTRSGPINALKRIYYIDKPTIEADILLLENPEISIEHLRSIFEYGSVHGYGGERGMGEGRYKFELIKNMK